MDRAIMALAHDPVSHVVWAGDEAHATVPASARVCRVVCVWLRLLRCCCLLVFAVDLCCLLAACAVVCVVVV